MSDKAFSYVAIATHNHCPHYDYFAMIMPYHTVDYDKVAMVMSITLWTKIM